MDDRFSRTRLIIGDEGVAKLRNARVAVFGLGGVGGYTVEALARAGVGALDLIDFDAVSVSNLNRQILATAETVGRLKTDVAAERIASIGDCRVRTYPVFFSPEAREIPFPEWDYAVDAIDTVAGKIAIICRARDEGVPVISCMGTGNKLDPSRLKIADLYETKVCPLARVMRRELRKRGVGSLKVVYSEEEPVVPRGDPVGVPGSLSFVPAVAGLLIAAEVVRDLLKGETK